MGLCGDPVSPPWQLAGCDEGRWNHAVLQKRPGTDAFHFRVSSGDGKEKMKHD